MSPFFILLDISILLISSFIITWFFAVYLQLSPIQLFFIFSGLNFFNSVLQTYLVPFRIIAATRNQLETIKVFGVAVLGLLTGICNLGLLANRFGWMTAIQLGVGSFLVGPVVYGALWSVYREKVEYTLGSKSDTQLST